MDNNIKVKVRKVIDGDDLERIAELLYNTDQYIYPYWFENIDNCKKELPPLLVQDKFFFNVNNLHVSVDEYSGLILGVVCVVDKNADLNYDYTDLKSVNERYKFTVENYIYGLINEVKDADFAYISNLCVDANYRGLHIGSKMLSYVVDFYKKRLFNEIALDVLANNPSAIKLYQNLGFEQISDVFKGFNDPDKEKPDVFSMKAKIK